jgi:hypothetical protein
MLGTIGLINSSTEYFEAALHGVNSPAAYRPIYIQGEVWRSCIMSFHYDADACSGLYIELHSKYKTMWSYRHALGTCNQAIRLIHLISNGAVNHAFIVYV